MNMQARCVRAQPSKISAVALVTLTFLIGGCWDDEPCDAGQILKDNNCYPAPAVVVPKPDAGSEEGDAAVGDAATPAEKPDNFGEACTEQSDCAGGTAPVCGAPMLPKCFQTNCNPGEANAGACPSGWTCIATGMADPPSLCFNP